MVGCSVCTDRKLSTKEKRAKHRKASKKRGKKRKGGKGETYLQEGQHHRYLHMHVRHTDTVSLILSFSFSRSKVLCFQAEVQTQNKTLKEKACLPEAKVRASPRGERDQRNPPVRNILCIILES